MADLNQKIKISLDETRMLVLGTQVLMMIQFELSFQSAFESYPAISRQLVPFALGLLVLTFIILVSGPSYHRITCDGQPSQACQDFMTRGIATAVWPLALAMGLDGYIAFERLLGRWQGIAAGCAITVLASLLWQGMGLIGRLTRPPEVRAMKHTPPQEVDLDLETEVNQVLTEARVILPGAQAMVGFQFITLFEEAFWRIPAISKYVHLTSLCLTAITVVLLITPAAFHRIAEGGEDSRRLVRIASRCVVGALIPLALSISGDIYVVVDQVFQSRMIAATAAIASVVVSLGMWFGYTLARRRYRQSHFRTPAGTLAHS
ncbi:MAG TPA: DUF6328 family protein [Tepidisphaeraceae bacterium]|nr:DUF6328 family protein [Tepidisphaeraceae bacterium]